MKCQQCDYQLRSGRCCIVWVVPKTTGSVRGEWGPSLDLKPFRFELVCTSGPWQAGAA